MTKDTLNCTYHVLLLSSSPVMTSTGFSFPSAVSAASNVGAILAITAETIINNSCYAVRNVDFMK